MSGVLVCDYLLRRRKELGVLPANGAVVSTIVSTNMVRAVTEAFGMKYIDVLTGFKFIGEQMRLFERDHTYAFQFGMEESYGCKPKGCESPVKYYTYEVHAQAPYGRCRTRTVRASSSEQAERMVKAMLGSQWKIIGTVYQFKCKEEIKK